MILFEIFKKCTSGFVIKVSSNALKCICFIALLGNLVACGPFKPDSNSAHGDLDVRLPVPTKKTENQNQLPYEFQVVKLLQVFELQKVRGAYARFFLHPSPSDKGRLTGTRPNADFLKTEKNVYVPLNSLSAQMASIYYHMQNMALLDQKLGVGSINQWPRDIGLEVLQREEKTSETLSRNNAMYEGGLDAILIVPYDGDDLPIAVNGGILAHEHFHSLFYKLVKKKLTDEGVITKEVQMTSHPNDELRSEFKNLELTSKIQPGVVIDGKMSDDELRVAYNITLLKALNEGIADYWGWMYTNDDEFISHSLPVVVKERTLKISADQQKTLALPATGQIVEKLKLFASENPQSLNQNVDRYSYVLGTQFARTFKEFALQRQQIRKWELVSGQESIAQTIVRFLPELTKIFIARGKKEMVSPVELVAKLTSTLPDLSKDECSSLVEVLNRSQESRQKLECKTIDGKLTIQ